MEDNQLFPNRVYSVEVKKDIEEFEEFNPDNIKIQIFNWKDEYIGLEERQFKHDIIKMDRTKPLKELKEKIFKLYNFKDQDNLHIFKKMEFNQNSYTVTEIMNNFNELNASLINSAIYEGTKIYIELKTVDNFESNFIKVI